MATKKQKRERGEQKHKQFMAEVRKTGMEAQRKDREHREKKNREAWRDQHDKKHSAKNRLKECPLCQKPEVLNQAEYNSTNPVKETI